MADQSIQRRWAAIQEGIERGKAAGKPSQPKPHNFKPKPWLTAAKKHAKSKKRNTQQ